MRRTGFVISQIAVVEFLLFFQIQLPKKVLQQHPIIIIAHISRSDQIMALIHYRGANFGMGGAATGAGGGGFARGFYVAEVGFDGDFAAFGREEGQVDVVLGEEELFFWLALFGHKAHLTTRFPQIHHTPITTNTQNLRTHRKLIMPLPIRRLIPSTSKNTQITTPTIFKVKIARWKSILHLLEAVGGNVWEQFEGRENLVT